MLRQRILTALLLLPLVLALIFAAPQQWFLVLLGIILLGGSWEYLRLAGVSSQVAGFLLVVFVAVLFLHGFVPWLFYAAIGVAVLSNLEEYALLALLPEWRADVRGLWWLRRERPPGD